jgi:alkanesulfonate monooxygenase SsuD/methylene tetrahydromethanopterin reductase-like flavin-dependent oxidoreductase (luciferase family)
MDLGITFGRLNPAFWDEVAIEADRLGFESVWLPEHLVFSHQGEHFAFEPVAFEPKPAQAGGPPILVGGESTRALRRAATVGDGWLGMAHTPKSAAERAAALRDLADEAGRSPGAVSVTVMGEIDGVDDLGRWSDAGVDRS